MVISLVLATVGRSQAVGRCLRSLAAQSDQSFEVLLIDQNSDDRLDIWVNEAQLLGLKLRHIRLKKPNLSSARNLGIAESVGAVVGFPDDDCWYEADVISNLRKAFAGDEHLDGCVANWVEQSCVRGEDASGRTLSLAAWRKFRGGDASSISLFFRRDLVLRLGGFDERIGVGQWFGAAEETDLIFRALAAGACLQRLPALRIHHVFGAFQNAPLALRLRNARSRARGTGAMYAKHQLTAYIVARGLAAPVLVPLVCFRSWDVIAIGLYTSLGRLEGLVRWGWGRP